MFRVFNMGIGMVVVVPPYYVDSVVRQFRKAHEQAVIIGKVVKGKGEVRIV